MADLKSAARVLIIATLVASSSVARASTVAATLAGRGEPGFVDGRDTRATFMMPGAVAVDREGVVFIADAGANRIRTIRNGSVATLAGGGGGPVSASGSFIAGGYRDGAGSQARFRLPMGVAVGADGTVYVADSGNHCIRSIKNGIVSTVAGSPTTAGGADGPAARATFAFPAQLAVDTAGNVYVADPGNGVRRIAMDHSVSTIPLPAGATKMIVGVAVWGGPSDGRLFVADHDGLIAIDLASGRGEKFGAADEGGRRFGTPEQLAAIGPREVAFTDLQHHTIRVFRDNGPDGGAPGSHPIVGDVIDDASYNGGGYLDGSGEHVRFDAPRGIALAPNGDLVIGDAGNRRVRTIRGFDARIPRIASEVDSARPEGAGDVAFVGGAPSFYNTLWDQSIPGLLEARLDGEVRVAAMRYPDGNLAVAQQVVSQTLQKPFRAVVWLVTTVDLHTETNTRVAILQMTRAIASEARQIHRPLYIFELPLGIEADAYEEVDTAAFSLPGMAEKIGRERYDRLIPSVDAPGARVINLAPAIRANSFTAQHVAFFGAGGDPNLTPAGRAFVAASIADELAR